MKKNIEVIESIYSNCSDVVYRPFLIGGKKKATLIYIDALTHIEELDDHVLKPLMQENGIENHRIEQLVSMKIPVADVIKVATFSDCVDKLSIGNPILFCEGEASAVSLGLTKWEKRSIEEPSAEAAIRGPREGFTETLAVNQSLLRRIIRSPALKMEAMTIGRITKTNVTMAYIEGLTDQTLIKEVKTRLQRIELDGILESGYLEEFMEDNPYSPFPQLLSTERPDVTSANLLEGRVAILTSGTPLVLIAPTTLFSLLQASEDYYQRALVSTVIRWMRYFFILVSLLLPSLYVAVLTYHQEMVPTSLLLSMAASREAVPFPAIIEALIMEVTFEGLREAGIRLPKQVGAAVSIVGALVIGQAAVDAGLVSAPMVIVVAITGIASFMIPRYIAGMPIRLLRFPVILLAGTLGLLGVMLGIILMVVHLCSLRSFGVPYLSPLAPLKGQELKDALMRAHWWMMDSRPHMTGEDNKRRQPPGQKPGPEKGGDA